MNRLFASLLLFAPALAFAPVAAHAGAPSKKIEKPIKVFVNAIRYGKDDLALKYVDGPAQAQFLTGDAWAGASPAQQKEFVALFHVIFAQLAFPKLKDNLQKIETILYSDAKAEMGAASITSTLVVLHPMKKQEVKVHYRLSEAKGKYRLVDVTFEGDASLLTNIRDDQIEPLLSEGGFALVLDTLRARVGEIKAQRKG